MKRDAEFIAKLTRARYQRLVDMIRRFREDEADRLARTKTLFGRRVYAVDVHTHSCYSDGRGTVDENYERALHAGLDFMFATDHSSLGQKRVVRRLARASWGQEPGAGLHHIGLLAGTRLFRPRGDSVGADYARACKLAPFVWVPHPTGWYPNVWYSDEAVAQLQTLPATFAMEVMNGAHKVVRAYDRFDARTVQVWDRLLCEGRRITALGGSDAHGPDDIGCVWTGVFAGRCRAPSLIRALADGRCFASESSVIGLWCGERPMGAVVRRSRNGKVRLRYRVADANGVASVRIVSRGRVLKEIAGRGRPVVSGEWTGAARGVSSYFRIESTAADDRRAFSTPLYVRARRN